MATKLSGSPSPRTFAEAFKKEIVEPASERIVGDDGNIDPTNVSRLRGSEVLIEDALESFGGGDKDAFIAHARAFAFDAAEVAAQNGRLSESEANTMPGDARMAYHFLRSGTLPQSTSVPTTRAPSFSQNVVDDVLSRYGLSDQNALIEKALLLDDGNRYLNRSELTQAAEALRNETPDLSAFSFNDNVIARIMNQYGIGERDALLDVARAFDADGNRYLKTSELEAAAKAMSGALSEIGIIADIDKTILPGHSDRTNLPDPYPGITQMLIELEGNQSGDLHYVTARHIDSVTRDDIPAWMNTHGLPTASIDTGVSPLPWISRPEKVKDISKHFDANPTQKFVLFGDNSHTDPGVYTDIIAKYPGRVQAAFIHRVKNKDVTLAPNMHVITNYVEAAKILFDKGVLDAAAARKVMVAAQVQGVQVTDAEIDVLLS